MSAYTDSMKYYEAVIYQLLSTSLYVSPMVADRIYPVIIDQEEVMPAIAFTYEIKPIHVKHSPNCMEDVIYNLYCVDQHYENCVQLTQAIRDELEKSGQREVAGLTVSQISLMSVDHAAYDKDRARYMIPVILHAQIIKPRNLTL